MSTLSNARTVTNTADATVTTSAKLILAGKASRRSVLILNNHASNDLYIGSSSSVTSSNGMRVKAGQALEFTDFSGDIYAIASAASTDVRLLEVG